LLRLFASGCQRNTDLLQEDHREISGGIVVGHAASRGFLATARLPCCVSLNQIVLKWSFLSFGVLNGMELTVVYCKIFCLQIWVYRAI